MQLYENSEIQERVILVAVQTSEYDDVQESLDELEELADTASAVTLAKVIQNRESVHPGTYVGKGKIEEIKAMVLAMDATGVICDDELSPAQMNNLERELECKVMDRTLLILDIFAGRAVSSEGKIQVELAQLRYRASRLVGLRESLSRLGGGIGTRGPGEKKLETDRRHIERRMYDIKDELAHLQNTRNVQRAKREKSEIPVVALVGYTNSGKSALMNKLLALTDKEEKTVFEKNMLFATLDTQQRNVTLENGRQFILIDTVGFVSKLPHSLVEAFKATLEEVTYADLLLHVVDSAYENHDFHIGVTNKVMKEIGAGDKEKIMVYNKIDLPHDEIYPEPGVETIEISAREGINIDELITKIEEKIFGDYVNAKFLIPYDRGDISSYICSEAVVKLMDYKETGTYFEVSIKNSDYQRFKKYEII